MGGKLDFINGVPGLIKLAVVEKALVAVDGMRLKLLSFLMTKEKEKEEEQEKRRKANLHVPAVTEEEWLEDVMKGFPDTLHSKPKMKSILIWPSVRNKSETEIQTF